MAFRDYILERFWLKLFSFILATLIWFTVHNIQTEGGRISTNPFQRVETRDYERTVRLVTLPTNRKLFDVKPLQVRITVKANSSVLDRIRQSDLQPNVILTDPLDVATTYSIEIKNLPPNIKVERITPPTVTVEPLRLPSQPL
jgi:hypothetical protein